MFLLLLKILLLFLMGYFFYNVFTYQSTVVTSIVGSLIVSLVMMVLTFQYNLRKQSIRNYLDSLRRCQWMMKQNLTILKVAVNESDIEPGTAAKSLKDLEPYLPDHFGDLDDMFRDNLLQCQNYINQWTSVLSYDGRDINDMLWRIEIIKPMHRVCNVNLTLMSITNLI